MNIKNIFEESSKIGYEMSKLQSELERLSIKCTEIMATCPHEIVFKYTDDYPRKAVTDGSYFCPACGKTIRCYHKNQLSETSFNSSRVIPLTDLSLFGTSEVHDIIRSEVYNNIELYYNKEIPVNRLSFRMQELLRDKENKYERPELVLKKSIRKK